MDIERAIDILNDPETDMVYTVEEIDLACLVAIKALNKQIPVKGLIEKYETINGGVLGEGRVCVCLICKEAIVPVGYCGECGQKLDW